MADGGIGTGRNLRRPAAIISGTLEVNNTLFRDYVPGEMRWLSPDPLEGDITNPQSLNRYAYVLNNPTNKTDPLGLATCYDDYGNAFDCPDPDVTSVTVNGGSPGYLSLIYCSLGFGGCGGQNPAQSYPTPTPPPNSGGGGGSTPPPNKPPSKPVKTNQAHRCTEIAGKGGHCGASGLQYELRI